MAHYLVTFTDGTTETVEVDTSDAQGADHAGELIAAASSRPDDVDDWEPVDYPATPPSPSEQLLRFFTYEHLPPDLRPISQACADLATWMQATLPDGPEKTTGLRKLLEAKDCFVRAALPADE